MFEKLTSVNESDKGYMYLVHTFFHPNGYSLETLAERLDILKDRRQKYDASIVCKLGCFNQVDTYGDFGVVLPVKEEDCIIAWDSDIFTPKSGSYERNLFFNWYHGRMRSLNQILTAGYYTCNGADKGMGYNNLVLKGRKSNIPQAIVYHPTPEGLAGKDVLANLLPNVPQIDLGISWKEGKLTSKEKEKLSTRYKKSVFDFSPKNATFL